MMDDIETYVNNLSLDQILKDSIYMMNTATRKKSVPDMLIFGNEVNALNSIKDRYIEMLKNNPELMMENRERGGKNEQHIEY